MLFILSDLGVTWLLSTTLYGSNKSASFQLHTCKPAEAFRCVYVDERPSQTCQEKPARTLTVQRSPVK